MITTNENKNEQFKEIVDKAKRVSFIIVITKGEINVQTSGAPMEYLIINEDSQSMVIKKVKDVFMLIPFIVQEYIKKWQKKL
jgi:hypothetical protein